jgi:3-hydroxyacyl-CoA dehydrogenase
MIGTAIAPFALASHKMPPSWQALSNPMLAPMIDECQQAVDDGVVDSVDSADAGMIFGIGFPGFRGGPIELGEIIKTD